MTPEQFAYWLQGFTELSPDMERPSAAQWQAIKDHLQTVFVKVTPPVGRPAGPLSTQEERPGKRLADALRELGHDPLPWPGRSICSPGQLPVITC